MIKKVELKDIMNKINYDLLKLTQEYGNELILGRGEDCTILHSAKEREKAPLKEDKSKFSMLENHALITQKNNDFFIQTMLKENSVFIFRKEKQIKLSEQFQEKLLKNNDRIYLGFYGPIEFKEYYDLGEFK